MSINVLIDKGWYTTNDMRPALAELFAEEKRKLKYQVKIERKGGMARVLYRKLG